MRALLDVNVLIAMFDPDHAFHATAHNWWSKYKSNGWASSPLTENGLIRIVSQPGYSAKIRFLPSRISAQLSQFVRNTDHQFWPDDLSLRQSEHFQLERVHSGKQITDLYLLALAAHNAGTLATFDGRIPLGVLPSATASNLLVIS